MAAEEEEEEEKESETARDEVVKSEGDRKLYRDQLLRAPERFSRRNRR